ncbi:hypothetical protein EIP86_006936 [Pleurotus ostreatoroseus]|nr:hypothetical protein EIP86_006936 [Pleurotus ostreatoroseus]
MYKGQAFEYLVRYMAAYGEVTQLALFAAQTIVLLGAQIPVMAPLGEQLCSVPIVYAHSLAIPPFRFIIGLVFVVVGGAVRMWCYRALGRFFVLEVVVTQEHTLVTDGPYAYVRHPSYTAMFLLLLGGYLSSYGPGTYVTECGLMSTPFRFAAYLWWALASYTVIATYLRSFEEDGQLRNRFGGAWAAYRREVPYKFIPFII